jgi:hypothetical protein
LFIEVEIPSLFYDLTPMSGHDITDRHAVATGNDRSRCLTHDPDVSKTPQPDKQPSHIQTVHAPLRLKQGTPPTPHASHQPS